MRVAYKWLKELVDVSLPPEELAEKMTMAGIAVEKVENLAQSLDRVCVGQITGMEHHPDADKLWICQVDVGTETRQIVTGAQNVQTGDKLPVAMDGAHLPNGVEIKPAKLRGVPSNGMLCSTGELNLDPQDWSERSQNGILILPEDAQVGQPFAEYLGVDEYVLELELYPNRADCLGMINVAREVAAIAGGALHLPAWANGIEPQLPAGEVATKVTIATPALCRRYAAMLIEDVKIGESPLWMKQRLTAAGMRPISNLVDITNYVMLEMGQPLHAFDVAKLAGNQIIVRPAQPGETIVTLDNVTRTLDAEMLVIADQDSPVAIAGVMGGLNSEVTADTRSILIESAHFLGSSVRRTSRKLGLRSEASQRFEKGVNAANLVAVLGRVATLVEQLGIGRAVGPVLDSYPEPLAPVALELHTAKVNALLGLNLKDEQIESTLARLDFAMHWAEAGKLVVQIPPYRADLVVEVDLIEEVARLHGFDKIGTTLPRGVTTLGKRSREQGLKLAAKKSMAASGFTEVINFSFSSPKALERLKLVEEHIWRRQIKVLNPLRDELSVMRTTLLPGLLETAARNVSRRNLDLTLFEQGYVYLPTDPQMLSLPDEIYEIAGLACGTVPKTWNQAQVTQDFFFVKGALQSLFTDLGINNYSFISVKDIPFMHPGRTANIMIRGKVAGFMGELHPEVVEAYALPGNTYVFVLDGPALFAAAEGKVKFSPVPRFPAVTRDIALLVDETVTVEKIYRSIRKVGKELLREVRLFDVYQGQQVPKGKKSLAFTLNYQSGERTLTDEEVTKLHETIKATLDKEFGAELRQ
ncbi:MAG: phenylalanine--tRNA ligase subunit beta [Peptococcaceae bacterium]|nr:phenylalanine--tRNA ligase subunit beta [Peptococcaceae bacterium]